MHVVELEGKPERVIVWMAAGIGLLVVAVAALLIALLGGVMS